MDGITELAKLLKERENRDYLGPQIGTVVNPLPNIKIRMGEKILLTSSHLIIASRLTEIELQSGDEVILIPSTDGQRYCAIDKVVSP